MIFNNNSDNDNPSGRMRRKNTFGILKYKWLT